MKINCQMKEKLFTLEFSPEDDRLELHLNHQSIDELIALHNEIKEVGNNDHFHLMTPEWGGEELSGVKQNLNDSVKLINHLKIFFWKDG